jgi:hypothetical protein
MMSDAQISRARGAAARQPVPVRRRRHPYEPHGRLWLAILAALAVAAAGAYWGARASIQAAHSRSRIAVLEARLTGLQRRIAADERVAAGERRSTRRVAARATAVQRTLKRIDWALQSVPSEAEVAGVRSGLAGFAACLPALQGEIKGLTLSWRIDRAKPANDSFKLFSSAPISASCAHPLTRR